MRPRGTHSLFGDLFDEQQKKPDVDVERRGRSADLIALRNECLIGRYYYYGKFMDKRYSRILDDLSNEFFLSTVTIPKILDENFDALTELQKQQPQKQYFQKKWPHFVWP